MKNRLILIFTLMLSIALLLSGCGSIIPGVDEEPSAKVTITNVSEYLWETKGTGVELSLRGNREPTYTLTTVVTPLSESPGSVIKYPLGPYMKNDLVWLTAIPATDWAFSHWSAISSSGIIFDVSFTSLIASPTRFKMPRKNIIVTAHFVGLAGQDLTLPASIYVYYIIENTGGIDIQEYVITFEAITISGIYTGIATGVDLAVKEVRNSYVKIDVFGNEVGFVDYNLELQ